MFFSCSGEKITFRIDQDQMISIYIVQHGVIVVSVAEQEAKSILCALFCTGVTKHWR
jgi:hypothetical protein